MILIILSVSLFFSGCFLGLLVGIVWTERNAHTVVNIALARIDADIREAEWSKARRMAAEAVNRNDKRAEILAD